MGAEIAKAALSEGYQVVATGRKLAAVSDALGTTANLLPLAMDVTNPEQIDAAVSEATSRFGRIDVSVNNAGYGHLGVFEEASPKEIRDQLKPTSSA